MADRRQVLRGILLGAAGAAVPSVLAGCGVPTGGAPIVDGPGPSGGTGGLVTGASPPGPDKAATPIQLVQYYLQAAAGPLDQTPRTTLVDSARRFLRNSKWTPAPPDGPIQVVRIEDSPAPQERQVSATTTLVDLTLRLVGQLTTNGAVQSGPNKAVACSFTVETGQNGMRISGIDQAVIANALVLSTDALDDPTLFTPQLIYYWSTSPQGDVLVPDVRYLSLAGGAQNQQTAIVHYLVGQSPNNWLSATPLPTGAALNGPLVYQHTDQLVVNLKPAAYGDRQQLVDQLRWSLFPKWEGPVQLQLNSQPQSVNGSGSDYLNRNLASASRRPHNGEEFCVAGGQVRPRSADTPLPALLDSPANTNVVWAALSRDKRTVALVRPDAGGNRYALWLGVAQDSGPVYAVCRGWPSTPTTMGRPVWLPDLPRVLVVADNRLYVVDVTDKVATDITPSTVQQVKGFSLAPDGRRIALVADGTPAVASLILTNAATQVTQPAPFSAPKLAPGSLGPIAWSRLDRVVLSGRTDDPAPSYVLQEISIDGLIVKQVGGIHLVHQITQVVAYPPPPSAFPSTGKVMIQVDTGSKAYSMEAESGQALKQLAPIPVEPAPSPSASAKPPQPLTPLAPFFVD